MHILQVFLMPKYILRTSCGELVSLFRRLHKFFMPRQICRTVDVHCVVRCCSLTDNSTHLFRLMECIFKVKLWRCLSLAMSPMAPPCPPVFNVDEDQGFTTMYFVLLHTGAINIEYGGKGARGIDNDSGGFSDLSLTILSMYGPLAAPVSQP